MHAVTLVAPSGERRQVVVRRYGAWRVEHDPRVAEREWAVLEALARAQAPTPRPLWIDAAGTYFGSPTIVIERLPGRGLLNPRHEDNWIRQLAEALAQIHATSLDEETASAVLDQRSDLVTLLERPAPPDDMVHQPRGPEIWEALRRWWPRIDASGATLVHGDYWPGNTLWRYGRLTGVIDWEQARRGNRWHDVACCRLDLILLAGPGAADTFVRAYEAAAGCGARDLFFWDLRIAVWAIEGIDRWVNSYHDLGRTDVTAELARARLDRFIDDALALADGRRPQSWLS